MAFLCERETNNRMPANKSAFHFLDIVQNYRKCTFVRVSVDVVSFAVSVAWVVSTTAIKDSIAYSCGVHWCRNESAFGISTYVVAMKLQQALPKLKDS